MAEKDYTNEQDIETSAQFRRFKWHRKAVEDIEVSGRVYAGMAGQIIDVTNGVGVILELLEFDGFQDDASQPRMLDSFQSSSLMRLAMESLRMLEGYAEDGLKWAYECHTEEGKAESLRLAQSIATA